MLAIRGPGPPQFNFFYQFKCIARVKLKVLVLKVVTSGPQPTFFERNAIPEPDLPHGTVPRALRSDGVTFFWISPILDMKMLQKSRKCQGPRAIVPFLNSKSPPPSQFLRDKILLKKN